MSFENYIFYTLARCFKVSFYPIGTVCKQIWHTFPYQTLLTWFQLKMSYLCFVHSWIWLIKCVTATLGSRQTWANKLIYVCHLLINRSSISLYCFSPPCTTFQVSIQLLAKLCQCKHLFCFLKSLPFVFLSFLLKLCLCINLCHNKQIQADILVPYFHKTLLPFCVPGL